MGDHPVADFVRAVTGARKRISQERGEPRILAILESMHDFYQEPRYRPSPWLKRRAQLCVSLLTPE